MQKRKNISNRPFPLMIIAIILFSGVTWGCESIDTRKTLLQQLESQQLLANPDHWYPGDTIIISFPMTYDTSKWLRGSIGMQVRGSKTSVIKNSENFRLKWMPDSIFLQVDTNYVLMTSGLTTLSLDTEFVLTTKYLILKDIHEQYYFKKAPDIYEIDTISLNLPEGYFSE